MRRMAESAGAAASAAASAVIGATGSSAASAPRLQYIVLRSDLKWPKGALAAQAAHVSVACLWENRHLPEVEAYLAPGAIDSMHKCVLGIDSADGILRLKEALDASGVPSRVWCEQPENVVTAIATVPGLKDDMKAHFEGLKLLR